MTTQRELRILTVLRSMESLKHMETTHLRKLSAIATEQTFPVRQIIYREGDVGQAVYLIKSGEVVIEMNVPAHGHVPVFAVRPGQLFGWSALFPGQHKGARARVIKPTQAIVLDAGRLKDLFQTDPRLEHAFTRRMIEVVADRIRATRQELAKLFAEEAKVG